MLLMPLKGGCPFRRCVGRMLLCRREAPWLRAMSGMGWIENTHYKNRCRLWFTETLTLCSTQTRVRSSVTDLRAIFWMACTSAVFESLVSMWGRRWSRSAPSFTAEVGDKSFNHCFVLFCFLVFLKPGCIKSYPEELEKILLRLLSCRF